MMLPDAAELSVATQCRLLGVSVSGYHKYVRQGLRTPEATEPELTEQVQQVFCKNRKAYGSRRMRAALKQQGHTVGRHKLRRVMRELGLICRPKRKRAPQTTDSKHNLAVAENRLQQDFSASRPNEAWVTDITYLPCLEGWLYLVAILDLFSRKVVGYAMSENIDRHLVLQALDMALLKRGPVPGLIHHSDRGSQFACHDYQQALSRQGIVCSMSRKGNCYDNAVAESFNKTIKIELIECMPRTDRATLRTRVFEYIEGFYNRRRLHSFLNYVSPEQFENNYATQPMAA
jgi:putative transposase